MLQAFFIRQVLEHIRDGNKGSNLLGLIAGALVALNLDWGKVLHGLETQESAIECAKVVATVVGVIWCWYIGKPVPPKPQDPPKAP